MEKMSDAVYKKGINYILFISYALIIITLYFSFILSAKNNAGIWIKGDMRNSLNLLVSSIDSDFEIKSRDVVNFTKNNTLKRPLALNILYALNDFTEEARNEEPQKSYKSLDKLIIIDRQNQILLDNTALIKDLSSIRTGDSTYSTYIYLGRIMRVLYQPVFEGEDRVGAIIAAYDFSDFYNAISKALKGAEYMVFGSVGGRITFYVNKNGVSFVKPSIETINSNEGFLRRTINGNKYFLLSRSFKLSNNVEPFTLSIAMPYSKYNSIEGSYISKALLSCTAAAVLITVILAMMYIGLRRYTRKEISNKLEILDLRKQRHDFSKHLNIMGGMAATGEIEELKLYLESLSRKTVFQGIIAKVDNPPVNVLLQEKELEAYADEIRLEVCVNASLRHVHVDPAELCTMLANLIDNGMEASMKLEPEKRFVRVEIGYEDGNYMFRVENTGNPITERNIERIFQPGYSTASGKGRGMGLYIVKNLVKKYHGNIEVDSTNGFTVFTVYIPDRRKD